MALRGPVQSRLAASLTPKFSREFPDRANPVESSSTPAARHGRVSGARPLSQQILEIWCEARAHISDPVGIPCVYSTTYLLGPCFPSRPCSSVSKWCRLSHLRDLHGPLHGYFIWLMSLNPLWEEVTPQCVSSRWKGMLSQCCPSPTVWVVQGTAVVDLLCVEPGPIVCLIGRIRRPTQGAGGGSSCGTLVGITICRSPTWLFVTDWLGTSLLRM